MAGARRAASLRCCNDARAGSRVGRPWHRSGRVERPALHARLRHFRTPSILPNARSLLTFDSAAARARIEALPWIETASISRVFPGSLDIRVTERKPVALWIEGDALISHRRRGPRALRREAGGAMCGCRVLRARARLRKPRRCSSSSCAFRAFGSASSLPSASAERRWTLHLKNHLTIHLAADREAVAFAALSSSDDLGALLSGHDLIIDLRTPRTHRRASR